MAIVRANSAFVLTSSGASVLSGATMRLGTSRSSITTKERNNDHQA